MIHITLQFVIITIIGIGITIGLTFVGNFLQPNDNVFAAIFALFGVVITTLIVILNSLVDSGKKHEVEWIEGMNNVLTKAREMRQDVNSCIKAVWCLKYKDQTRLLQYLNEDSQTKHSIERIINTKVANRKKVKEHLCALKEKLKDGTYTVTSTKLAKYEFYLVDGESGLILLTHGITAEDISAGMYSKNKHFVAWLEKVFNDSIENEIEMRLDCDKANGVKVDIQQPEKSIDEWLNKCYGPEKG